MPEDIKKQAGETVYVQASSVVYLAYFDDNGTWGEKTVTDENGKKATRRKRLDA